MGCTNKMTFIFDLMVKPEINYARTFVKDWYYIVVLVQIKS